MVIHWSSTIVVKDVAKGEREATWETTKILKLCVLYPDSSTFLYLAIVPEHVSIQLLIISNEKGLIEGKEKYGSEGSKWNCV